MTVKSVHLMAMMTLAGLAGCSSWRSANAVANAGLSPETVLITYHVIPGKEQQLQQVLASAWEIYQNERLVFVRPHLIVQSKEDDGKSRFVEVFTWVSHDAPDHAPDSVKKLWGQMQACCEKRNGHEGLEGGEVSLVVPAAPSRW